jgi:ribonuclease J
MRLCIKRGARQIGGSCVELAADNGKKLLIDLGAPLDVEKVTPDLLPDIDAANTFGLLLSHAHGDHYALAQYLDDSIPVYVSQGTLGILEAIDSYSHHGQKTASIKHPVPIEPRQPFLIADTFQVTAYQVDHSTCGEAFLIEADGARVFYTGDFRTHGRTGYTTRQLIARPPQDVDILLMEGTMLGRADVESPTEESLVACFEEEFRKTRGVVAVAASSTNINRIVTLYKAAKNTGRELIVPWHVGLVTMKTGNPKIPNFKYFDKFRKWKEHPKTKHDISPEKILREPGKYVVFLKSAITETMLENGMFCSDAAYIWSMWNGYKKEEWNKARLERIAATGTRMVSDIHTGGHADTPTLQRFAQALAARRIVPIHTEHPDRYRELFGETVEPHSDGEYFDAKIKTTIGHNDMKLNITRRDDMPQKSKYSKSDILKKCADAIKNPNLFYAEKFVNYTSRIDDGSELISEVIADYILQNVNTLNNIPSIQRKSGYRGYPGETLRDGKPGQTPTNREEEWLVMAMKRQGKVQPLGNVIDYQTPLKNVQKDKCGKIDLLIQSFDLETLYIIELKRGEKSNETLLRAILEAFTYFKVVDHDKLKKDFELQPTVKIQPVVALFEGCQAQYELESSDYPKVHALMQELEVKAAVMSAEKITAKWWEG